MAIVSADQVALSIQMIDRTQRQYSHNVRINGVDAATRLTNAVAYVALWEAVSGLEVTGYNVGELYYENAITVPANTTNLGATRASVTLGLAGLGNKKANLAIAGAVETLFTGGGNTVNIADTDLVALVNAYKAGGYALISDGESVRDTDPIIAGRRVTYKTGGA